MSKRRTSIDAETVGAVVGTPATGRRRPVPSPGVMLLPAGKKTTRWQDKRGNWIRSVFLELSEADWVLLQTVALHRARPGERPSMKAVVTDLIAAARAGLEREVNG